MTVEVGVTQGVSTGMRSVNHLRKFNSTCVFAQSYSDDMVILVGKFAHLLTVSKWKVCTNYFPSSLGRGLELFKKIGLSVNPNKTTAIPFTIERQGGGGLEILIF